MIEVIYKNSFPKGVFTEEKNKAWFIKRLRQDILKAVEVWDKKHKIAYQIKRATSFAEGLETVKAKATKEAAQKYKTEFRRTEYINNELIAYITSNATEMVECKWYGNITFFDFNVEPGSNGIHNTCILNVSNLTDKALEACWNEIKDNEYFKEADGWQFENGEGRPQIRLHLSKNLQKKFKEERESLERAINDFYDGCTYWGD